MPVNFERGMPRSGLVAPSVPHEELEQISSCHTFSSMFFFTVASKEAVSVTPAFRGKQSEHSLIFIIQRFAMETCSNTQKNFLIEELACQWELVQTGLLQAEQPLL